MASYRPFPPQSSFAPPPTQNPLPPPPPQQQQRQQQRPNQNYPKIAPLQPPQAAAPSFSQSYSQMPSNYHYPPSKPQHPQPPLPPPQFAYTAPRRRRRIPHTHVLLRHLRRSFCKIQCHHNNSLLCTTHSTVISQHRLCNRHLLPRPLHLRPRALQSHHHLHLFLQPPPPPKESGLERGLNVHDKAREHGSLNHGVGLKLQQKPQVPVPPMAKNLNGLAGQMETEEERRLRKKREYEKQRLEERSRQQFKESQNTIIQKTQMMSLGKGHGSVVGSRMGDRRAISFLSGERIENRLKKPTTFLCKLK